MDDKLFRNIPKKYLAILEQIKTISPQKRNSFVKSNKDFHEWLVNNTPSECRSITEQLYLVNNPSVNPWCEQNNFKAFKNNKYQNYCSGHCYCSKKKKTENFKHKHGVENPMQLESIKSKARQTNLEKYGFENPQKSDIVKQKTQNTNIKKYGVKTTLMLDTTIQKAKQTNIKKYGAEFVLQSESGKQRVKQTNISKYGVDNPGKISDHAEKIKKTSLTKYGKDHIMKTQLGKSKQKESLYETHGFENPKHIGKSKKLVDEFNNDQRFISVYEKYNTVKEVAEYFEFSTTPIQKRAKQLSLKPKSSTRSAGEICLEKELSSYTKHITTNDRKTIYPYEIDILIDKVGIEFNGAYWHSSRFIPDKKYHLNKTNIAKNKGISLIHIYDFEWNNKKQIVLSLLKSKLGFIQKKIHARKCQVIKLDNKMQYDFFENNHLQGGANCSVSYGLVYHGVLVASMSFIKSRFDKQTEWELLRFANLLNTCVSGGASKLLAYFRKHHDGSIVSYANKRFSDGNLYSALGFDFEFDTKPNYFYMIDGKPKSRLSFQKHKLKKILENFDSNKTEIQNMIDNGFYPIYDCGNQKWRLK